jgi:hypothetical protein
LAGHSEEYGQEEGEG